MRQRHHTRRPRLRASAIVAYHPPIWKPLDRITSATATERIVRRAIEAEGVSASVAAYAHRHVAHPLA